MRKLRIFIIDESPFFRTWFRKLILAVPGIRVVGEAEDPIDALNTIGKRKPDAIILDMKTQWRCGIDLVKSMRKFTPVPKVILLTSEIYCRYEKRIWERADFLLDKVTEYRRIPEILKRVASDAVSGAAGPGKSFPAR
ncbi:MAG: response regulator [Nitrospirae bacterium]|nr:response regulator [Nitrospirota bacterium]